MKTLQIRDVPDHVALRLAEGAKANGQSLQGYLLNMVTEEAQILNNTNIIRQLAEMRLAPRLTQDDIIVALDEARAERDAELFGSTR